MWTIVILPIGTTRAQILKHASFLTAQPGPKVKLIADSQTQGEAEICTRLLNTVYIIMMRMRLMTMRVLLTMRRLSLDSQT